MLLPPLYHQQHNRASNPPYSNHGAGAVHLQFLQQLFHVAALWPLG